MTRTPFKAKPSRGKWFRAFMRPKTTQRTIVKFEPPSKIEAKPADTHTSTGPVAPKEPNPHNLYLKLRRASAVSEKPFPPAHHFHRDKT